MSNFDIRLIFVFLFTALLGVFYFYGFGLQQEKDAEYARALSSIAWPYSSMNLLARSAVVYDANDDIVIYQKHANTPLPLASITKTMTSIVSAEVIPTDAQVEISKTAISADGDTGLILGEKWALSDLEKVLLVSSSNDAAVALKIKADEVLGGSGDGENFIIKMNKKARELGLDSFNFSDESGLDIGDAPGATGSAKDVSKLLAYAVKTYPETWAVTRESYLDINSIDGFPHRFKNTDDLAGILPELIASKTGYTDLAGGNLTVMVKIPEYSNPLVITVLGSTREARFIDITTLLDTTRAYIRSIQASSIPIHDVLQMR